MYGNIHLTSIKSAREGRSALGPSVSLPPLTHASLVGGQAAWEQQTTPSAPSAGSSCSATERRWRRVGKNNSYKRRGEEKSRRWKEGLFPKRRDYNSAASRVSACRHGVNESRGLLRWSRRCCSAPAGQVGKVSASAAWAAFLIKKIVSATFTGPPGCYCLPN